MIFTICCVKYEYIYVYTLAAMGSRRRGERASERERDREPKGSIKIIIYLFILKKQKCYIYNNIKKKYKNSSKMQNGSSKGPIRME